PEEVSRKLIPSKWDPKWTVGTRRSSRASRCGRDAIRNACRGCGPAAPRQPRAMAVLPRPRGGARGRAADVPRDGEGSQAVRGEPTFAPSVPAVPALPAPPVRTGEGSKALDGPTRRTGRSSVQASRPSGHPLPPRLESRKGSPAP